MTKLSTYIFTLIISLNYLELISQNNQTISKNEFAKIQDETNTYFINNPDAKGYKQWKRKEWFLRPRLYGEKKIENISRKSWAAYESYKRKSGSNRNTHGAWSFIGPLINNTGQGRVNSIEIHPSNLNIIYIGSSNGGVWKSTNGGNNWTNKSPNIPLLAIADIKINPSNENELFALTGDGDPAPYSEGNVSHGQEEIRSIGLLKSNNGGDTWYPTGFSIEQSANLTPTKLMIHPTNANIQFIASNNGLFYTINQWQTFDTVISETTFDIEYNPGNTNIMYASGMDWIRKSTDGGSSWNIVMDADFSVFNEDTRIELAVAPNENNVVYALAGDWGGLSGILLSTANGTDNSWQLINNTTFSLGKFARYCTAIEVNPNDWTNIFAGFQWICKSGNSGQTWTSIDYNVVHADIHDIKYVGSSLYVACDGGVYKSNDEGNTWSILFNGLGITEIYRMSGTNQNENLHLIGTQDNGTMEKTSSSLTFGNPGGGDGMNNHINPVNVLVKYLSSQNGSIARTTDGTNYTSLNIPGGSGAWVTPFVFDPIVNMRMFVGKKNVFRSENGFSNWQMLESPFNDEFINQLALSNTNENKLYITSGENIAWTDEAMSTSSNINWNDIGVGLPDLFITDIVINPNNDEEIFVTLSGYSDGQRVYKSNNSGSTWINITGSLPAVPVNCISFHVNGQNNDAIYIGTDIGVFYRNNDIGDWIYYSNSMPVAIITDLFINSAFGTISASTYGRGLWKSNLFDGCLNNITFNDFNGGVAYYSASNTISCSVDLPNDFGHEVYLKAGNSVSLIPGFSAGGHILFNAKTGPCPSPLEDFSSKILQDNLIMSEDFYRELIK